MDSYVLRVNNITKKFPGVLALKGVSIDLKHKEVLGLIGENGAGKSTLLNILNGVYNSKSFSGDIFLENSKVEFHTPHDAQQKGIGFVPQEINVLDKLTVAENIFVYCMQKISSKGFFSHKRILKQAKALIKKYDLNLDPKSTAGTLSIAQKQRLMIARALAMEPKILILDEPTTSLSIEDVDNLFEIVKGLKDQGCSTIFVTHKLEEIRKITDRVYIMRDGENISNYSKGQYDEQVIVADMVGRVITDMYPKRNVKIGEEVLKVENISVLHPRIAYRNLIENVSFSLRKGEVLGLAGLVGAGRTEVLNALYGRLPINVGKIYVKGVQKSIRCVRDARENGITMVTEDRKNDGLLMLSNIRNNINSGNLSKVSKKGFLNAKKENECANKYFKLLNVKANDMDTMVVNLSGGNQQKVVIGKALNLEPQIILLDEPTKGIDVGSKNEIYNIINQLADMGISVILVTSELPELIGMCDRFIVMSGGTVVGEFSKDEVSQEKIIAACCK